MPALRLQRLYHTIRYLKPVQIYSRALARLPKRGIRTGNAPSIAHANSQWKLEVTAAGEYLESGRFRFLNKEATVDLESTWIHPIESLLWTYNLNYFDFLFHPEVSSKPQRGKDLIEDWIQANSDIGLTPWAPYPSSLRIVNWIRFHLSGHPLSQTALDSLTAQLRYLNKTIEYHIQANHLLTNGKSLFFGGMFFQGEEAHRWKEKGLGILLKEIPEQTLSDGGNYELSPMYHSILLKDILDLINLMHCFEEQKHQGLHDMCYRYSEMMFSWLRDMRHPNGNIPLFNDAAHKIAPTYEELVEYAKRLGAPTPKSKPSQPITHFPESGYFKFNNELYCLIGDVANVGPDHQPGHAHADTFSFELTVNNCLIFSDTGTSAYTEQPRRDIERATLSHNTVAIDRLNSSEVWGHHRVARRARVTKCQLNETDVTCSHDGYTRLEGVGNHTRRWHFAKNNIEIFDLISGKSEREIHLSFHCAPGCNIQQLRDGQFDIKNPSLSKFSVRLQCPKNWEKYVEDYYYAPEFGKRIKARRIVARFKGSLPQSFKSTIKIVRDDG